MSSTLSSRQLACLCRPTLTRNCTSSVLPTPFSSHSGALPRPGSAGSRTLSPLHACFSTSSSPKKQEKRGLAKKIDSTVLDMSDVKEGFEHVRHQRYTQGVSSLTRAHDVLSTSLGKYDVNTIYIRERLARAYCNLYLHNKALPLLRETLHKDAFKSFDDDDVLDAYQTAFMCAVAGNMLDQAERIAMESSLYSPSHSLLALGTVALMRGQPATPFVSRLDSDSDSSVRVVSLYTSALSLWRLEKNASVALKYLRLAGQIANDPDYPGYRIPDKSKLIIESIDRYRIPDKSKLIIESIDPDPRMVKRKLTHEVGSGIEYSGEGGRHRCGIFREDIWTTLGEVLFESGDESEGLFMTNNSLRLARTYSNEEAELRIFLTAAKYLFRNKDAFQQEGLLHTCYEKLANLPPCAVRQAS